MHAWHSPEPEPEPAEPASDAEVAESLDRALLLLGELQRELEDLADGVTEDEELRDELEGRLLDLRSCATRLHRAEHALRRCLRPGRGGPPTVRWMEITRQRRGRQRNLALAAVPVDVGSILSEHLFAQIETGILTSATMAVGGDMSYLRGRLGIDGEVPESVFGSPFNHRRQSCLVVPRGLPPAGDVEASAESAARVVADVAGIAGGGVFALFTSFAALRRTADGLRRSGAAARWPLFVQGEADRSALLADFARSGSAVLLGTSSFWEGVDVPGWPLRALVIHKLPFRVPTEPVTEARLEAVTARGENAFMALTVPDAAVRLKQGVGRLVRTRTDRGAIVLLDDRILTRRYGRILREALPPMPLVRGPWEVVRQEVEAFYGAGAPRVRG